MSDAQHSGTVVVGYDGSEAARRALQRARSLSAPGARLLVIAVVPDLTSAGLGHELSSRGFDPQRLLTEAARLLGMAGQNDPGTPNQPQDAPDGIDLQTYEATGDPAAVLLDAARDADAQLLVVGRRGGDFIARTLLGSVAQRVVAQAPCDVLVVA